MQYEMRLTPSEFEVRSVGNSFQVEGYAAKWGTRSQDLGGFVETISAGASAASLAAGVDTRALFNHDANLILGRRGAGTLRVSEDSTGIPYQIDMPDTSYARDLVISIERGDVDQSSFGFRTVEDDWTNEGRSLLRTLVQFELLDVSPVTYPAYLDTYSGVGTRSLAPSAVLAAYEARSAGPTIPPVRFTAPDIEDAYGLALRARLLGGRD
jgi:HK97 family phage prohead protease